MFLYHSRDEVVPFAHAALCAQKLRWQTIQRFNGLGHQFDDDFSEVGLDIGRP